MGPVHDKSAVVDPELKVKIIYCELCLKIQD